MNRGKNIILLLVIIAAALLAGFFVIKENFGGRNWRLGLDLVGGTYLIYKIDLTNVPSPEKDSVATGLRDVMEKRVNAFGVSEPQVYLTKTGKEINLVVELAGIKDVKSAIEQIGRTAFLEFKEVEPSRNTLLSGRFLAKAAPVFNPTTGLPEISLQFTGEGAKIFEELTGQNIGKSS